MSELDADASDLHAKVFEDRITHGEWRVEGVFDVIWLEPYRR